MKKTITSLPLLSRRPKKLFHHSPSLRKCHVATQCHRQRRVPSSLKALAVSLSYLQWQKKTTRLLETSTNHRKCHPQTLQSHHIHKPEPTWHQKFQQTTLISTASRSPNKTKQTIQAPNRAKSLTRCYPKKCKRIQHLEDLRILYQQ